jgi:hypothetical protein
MYGKKLLKQTTQNIYLELLIVESHTRHDLVIQIAGTAQCITLIFCHIRFTLLHVVSYP